MSTNRAQPLFIPSSQNVCIELQKMHVKEGYFYVVYPLIGEINIAAII